MLFSQSSRWDIVACVAKNVRIYIKLRAGALRDHQE